MALGHVTREKDGKKPPTRYYSNKQEKAGSKETAGSQTSNSGATPFQKGDVLTDLFLLEAKTKTSPSASITIQKGWFEKNATEAAFMGKPYSALVFNFGPDEPNYYVIDKYLFQDLLEYLEKKDL